MKRELHREYLNELNQAARDRAANKSLLERASEALMREATEIEAEYLAEMGLL
jgi:DnaJ-domain-containing protein 1